MANCQHDNRVRILGGNQSKSVCERDCPLSVHVIKGSWVNTDGQCRRGRQRFVDVHQRREHWKHEYRNVMMTGYAVSINEDGKITEGMMFSYSRVEVTYTLYDANGKACNPVRVAYDVSAAKLA